MSLELEGVRGLVESDPGPERVERHVQRGGRGPDVLVDEDQPAGLGFRRQQRQVVLAEDALPEEAQQVAELARRHHAVGDGHRRLDQPDPRRQHLLEQAPSRPCPSAAAKVATLSWTHVSRSIDAAPFDDAGQPASEGSARAPARSPPWRRRRPGPRAAARTDSSVPGALPDPSDGHPLRRVPIDQAAPRRPLDAPAQDGDGGAQTPPRRGSRPGGRRRAASSRTPAAPRRGGRCRSRPALAGRGRSPLTPGRPRRSTRLDVREGLAEHPLGDGSEGRHVAGRELAVSRRRRDLAGRLVAGHSRVRGRAPRRARRLEGVDREQLGQRRGRGRGRIHDRHAVADGVAQRSRQQRVVSAAEQQGVDPSRRRQREDELAVLVPLARAAARRPARTASRPPARSAGRPRRAERARASRARRPRWPGSRP